MSKTKIIVLQMKELVYTGIFVGLGILLIVLLFVMFYPKKEKSSDATADVTAEAASYVPGIYNSELKLGENTLNLEVVVDEDQIKSVSFVNLDDSVTTMYPLVKPSLEGIEKELIAGTPIDEIPVQETCTRRDLIFVLSRRSIQSIARGHKAKSKPEEQSRIYV